MTESNTPHVLQFPIQLTPGTEGKSDDTVILETRLSLVQYLAQHWRPGVIMDDLFKQNVKAFNRLCSEHGYYHYLIVEDFD